MLDHVIPKREPRRRALAAVLALAVGAVLAVVPAMGATAAVGDDIETLRTAAVTARAEADSAAAAADEADAAADAAEADAVLARENAAAALAAVVDGDAETQAAADAAEAAALAAEAAAAQSRDAADAAASAAELSAAAADAAEAELAAALADAEATESATVEPSVDASSERGSPSCDVLDEGDFDKMSESERRLCLPRPDVDVYVTNVCPAELTIVLSHLVHWIEYVVVVEGVEYPVMQHDGRARVTVTDVEPGRVDIEVRYGDHQKVEDHVWIDGKCPQIRTDVEKECRVIGGTAEVEFAVWYLSPKRVYEVTISGPNGYEESFIVAHRHSFEQDLHVPPGEYTVTVESHDHEWPHIGPMSETVIVPPCPGEVTIGFASTCATGATGTLGATLSGLVPGREYAVVVEGPSGIVLETEFIAESNTWQVPTGALPPGDYTVTVTDTHGYASAETLRRPPMHEPLMWSATGTIGTCPPVPTQLTTLALTGSSSSGLFGPALGVVAVGAGLLAVRRMRQREEVGL